jgi:DDE superfamily endonuclease
MGLEQVAQFSNYHRVLGRNIWSSRWLSRRLFRLLVDSFVTDDEPVLIGLDDTIERRWGARIKHVASTEIRCALRAATSPRRAACAGSR